MKPTLLPRVKVCCIMSRAEARLAIEGGASALGLVSAMPSGPGVISDELIADIASDIPPPIATFLLTSRQSVAGIAAQHRRLRTTAIQIVDTLIEGSYAELRDALPGVKFVQVIHVVGEHSIDQAEKVAGQVDALLLDSGRPDFAVKELGGTGRPHDWRISRRIREGVEIPIFLAGGLNAANVEEAIHDVRPFGIDLCSGVRTNGMLDGAKLAAFMEAVRKPL